MFSTMFEAGTLSRVITIQQRIDGTDAAGQPLLTWVDVATVHANIAGQSGLGTIKHSGDVTASIKSYSFRIRYRKGLNEGMRVVYDSQNFDVKAVRMDFDSHQFTDLVADLGGNDG